MGALVRRALLARPLRSLLTVAAVALGIAAVLGVQLSRAGLDAQAAQAAAERAGQSSLDVRVTAGSGLSADEVKALSRLSGVSLAVPLYEKRVIAAPQGSGFRGLTVTAVGLQDDRVALRPVQVLSGHLPAAHSRNTVAIDQDLATALTGVPGRPLRLGDRIQMITETGPDAFQVVGFTGTTSAGPTFTRSAVFVSHDTITGALQLGLRTPLVALRLAPGVAAASVAAEVHQAFGETVTADDPRAGDTQPIANLGPLLALVTVLSIIVGAGVTANSIILSITERRRDIGLLRAAGASKRQVFRAFAAETVALASLAAPVGVGLGVGFGALLDSRFTPADLPVPVAALSPGPVLLAVLAGWGAAMVGGIVPAILASNTSILDALRHHPAGERERISPMLAVLSVSMVAASAICFVSADGALVALGAILFLAGMAVSLPLAAPYAARLVATLLSPVLPGSRAAAANLRRQRNRMALTISGLALSVACAVGVSALTAGALGAGDSWVHQLFVGNVLVRSPVTQLDSVADALSKNSAVQRVTPLRVFSEPVAGSVVGIATIDPQAYRQSNALQIDGDHDAALSALQSGPVVLAPASLASSRGWQVGSRLPIQTLQGTTLFSVGGVVMHSYPAGDGTESLVMASTQARKYFGDTADGFDDLQVTTTGGTAAIDATASTYGMQAVPVSAIIDATHETVTHSIGLLLALAIIAVTIAMLAVINTLAMSVRSSTRDLALLRAVGLSRRQALRRMLTEAGLMATTATLIGVAAGCVIAFPMLRASSSSTFTPGFAFPAETAIVLAAVVVLGAVVATILPARRAVSRSVPSALKQD